MRVFLSHASVDKGFVQAVQAALPPHVKAWLDADDLYAGQTLGDEIRRAILDETDYVLLFVSATSLASAWVGRELVWALQREVDLGRPFVVPLLLPGVSVVGAAPPFDVLRQRLYIKAPADPAAASAELARHLFALASEWIETAGDSSRQAFISRLKRDLTRFKDLAFVLIASAGESLAVLGTRPEAHASWANAVRDYTEFSDGFIARKDSLRAQVRDLFGGHLGAEADKLLQFVERNVYRGDMFELNEIVHAINGFDRVLRDDPVALARAEARKSELLSQATKTLEQTTKRSLSFIAKLEEH
jgi:hypothetical protein